jgi:hypothetical protein
MVETRIGDFGLEVRSIRLKGVCSSGFDVGVAKIGTCAFAQSWAEQLGTLVPPKSCSITTIFPTADSFSITPRKTTIAIVNPSHEIKLY